MPELVLPAGLVAVLDGLTDGHSLYVPERDDAGRVQRLISTYINPAGCLLRGTTRREFIGSDMIVRYRAQGNHAAIDQYVRVLDTGEPMSRVLITDHVAGPRRTFEINGSCVVVEGAQLFSMSFRDVTHELDSRNRMRTAVRRSSELSRTDELTSLANRRGWQRAVDAAMAVGGPLCLAILDLDHFKAYNDSKGHQAGDELLVTLAARWTGVAPPDVTLARLGGEEFGALLGSRTVLESKPIVEQLRAVVPDGQTVSAGLAQRQHGESARDLMGRADEALYVAKRAGRDRVGLA